MPRSIIRGRWRQTSHSTSERRYNEKEREDAYVKAFDKETAALEAALTVNSSKRALPDDADDDMPLSQSQNPKRLAKSQKLQPVDLRDLKAEQVPNLDAFVATQEFQDKVLNIFKVDGPSRRQGEAFKKFLAMDVTGTDFTLSYVDTVVSGEAERILMSKHWWFTEFQKNFEPARPQDAEGVELHWVHTQDTSRLRKLFIATISSDIFVKAARSRSEKCLALWAVGKAKDQPPQATKGGSSAMDDGSAIVRLLTEYPRT